MLEPARLLVFQRIIQHPDWSSCLGSPHASYQIFETRKATEVRFDRCVCFRWLVSFLIHVSNVKLTRASTVITSVLRLHSLYIISVSTDPTWDNVGAATWSSLEVNVGIICSSLPILRPLVTKFFSRILASDIRSSHTLGSTTRPSAVNDLDLELQQNNAGVSSSGRREKPPLNGIAVTTFYTIEHDSSKEDLAKSISASSSNGTLGPLPSHVV